MRAVLPQHRRDVNTVGVPVNRLVSVCPSVQIRVYASREDPIGKISIFDLLHLAPDKFKYLTRATRTATPHAAYET